LEKVPWAAEKNVYCAIAGWNTLKTSIRSIWSIVSKFKRLPTEWEKIFSNYRSDKEFMNRYTGSSKIIPQNSMTQWRNGQKNWTEFLQRKKSK
jgi:hypothetical protein